MIDRLLRERDIAAMLGTTPGVAASVLAAHGVCPIDLGRGRSRGRHWLESAVRQAIMAMHAEAQPRRKARSCPPVRKTPSIATMSVGEIYEIWTPAGCVQ